eukprot:tig00021043_g17630.t1
MRASRQSRSSLSLETLRTTFSGKCSSTSEQRTPSTRWRARASRRLRDLHLGQLRHEEEKKWPIVSPRRILEAWAARVEKGLVKARSFQVDTTIDGEDVDPDLYGDDLYIDIEEKYGTDLDVMCDVDSPHPNKYNNYGSSEFWGRAVPSSASFATWAPSCRASPSPTAACAH